MRFRDLPRLPTPVYECDVSWAYLESWIAHQEEDLKVELDPVYQRGNVWTDMQQVRYVETCLYGTKSARNLYWNCVGWTKGQTNPLEIVDGKQRLNAVRRFLKGEIPAFDYFINEYEDRMGMDPDFRMCIFSFEKKSELLKWYLAINRGGTIHSEDEIARVTALLHEALKAENAR